MTGQIRITPEAMRGRAGEFRAARENFLNVVQSMSNLIGTLREAWEEAGVAADRAGLEIARTHRDHPQRADPF